MKIFAFYGIFLSFIILLSGKGMAQQVGIGTSTPSKMLSVKGTILVDAGNQNAGSPDSAALLFGTATKVGISSNRAGALNANGLDFWTNNSKRLSISNTGLIGINTSTPGYSLDINGTLRVANTLYANSSLVVDGTTYGNGNAYFYQNLYASNYMGIGISPSSSYKLNVNGNGRFASSLEVGGTAAITGKLTNEGKAIMLSNSSTTLRSGFTSGSFNLSLNAGSSVDVTFIVIPFTGSNNNIRVMISQVAPGSGASNYGGVVYTAHDPLASDPAYSNQSTVKIRMQNVSSSTANLGTGAILYLYSVVTD
jgi:hypothetical protein